MTATRPQWMRLDLDMLHNPKMKRLKAACGDSGPMLYILAMGYSVKHLTDGWIPPGLPAEMGYRRRHIDALEDCGLWIPIEITDDGGWLINDFRDYQVTRAKWEGMSEQRRKAAARRWQT